MDLRYRGAVLVLAIGALALAGVPVVVGWKVHDDAAGLSAALGVVIAAVVAVNGMLVAWWRYWLGVLRWLGASRNVRAAAATVLDNTGRNVGMGLAVGLDCVLTTRSVVEAAGSGPSGWLELEVQVRGRRYLRRARPWDDTSSSPRTSPLVVLELTEQLPSDALFLRLGRPRATGDVKVVHLDPHTGRVCVRNARQVNADRITDVRLPAGATRSGGFVVSLGMTHAQLVGVLEDGPDQGGPVTDPALLDVDLTDDLPCLSAPRRSTAIGVFAAGMTLLLAVVGWVVWPFPSTPPTVVRVAGLGSYFEHEELEKIFRRHGLAVKADHHSSEEVLGLVQAGFDAFTVSNRISESLLLRELDRQHVTAPVHRELFQRPMVVGTYQPVLDALLADPHQRLARKGPDGVLRLDTKAFVRSLAAQGSGTKTDRLTWGDVPGFPAAWDADTPVSITPASPCGAGGGVIFVGMVLRDLQADGADPATVATRARAALDATYSATTARQHSHDLARTWATPPGTPASPFTLMYENDAMRTVVEAPTDPPGWKRVVLYLDKPVVVSQYIVTKGTSGSSDLVRLLTDNSHDSVRIREIEASRFGLKFPGDGPAKAREGFIEKHHLGPLLNAGGPNAAGGLAPVELPNASRTLPFINRLCGAGGS